MSNRSHMHIRIHAVPVLAVLHEWAGGASSLPSTTTTTTTQGGGGGAPSPTRAALNVHPSIRLCDYISARSISILHTCMACIPQATEAARRAEEERLATLLSLAPPALQAEVREHMSTYTNIR